MRKTITSLVNPDMAIMRMMSVHTSSAGPALRPWLLSPLAIITIQGLISAAGLVVEILAGRMLAPYVGMSAYTWTAVIAVVLAGFSLGHWVGGLVAERPRQDSLGVIAICMALAAVTSAMTLPILRTMSASILSHAPSPGVAILLLVSVVFFLPSFFAGTPSPVLAKIIVDLQPGREGKALGGIFAASSVGAIIGTLATGFIFISWLGSTLTIVAVTLLYACLAILLLSMTGQRKHWMTIAASLIGALVISAYNLTGQSACTKESRYYCIRIIDFTSQVGSSAKLMVLDHLGHGINLAEYPRLLITPYVALIDLVVTTRLDGKPASSFFVGGGAYTLPRAWHAASPKAQITVSEIDPDVTDIARQEMWAPEAGIDVIHEDARTALRNSSNLYQVIVGDAFTDIAVPAHLVTLEFFRLVKARLDAEGIYAMNVVDHVPDTPALLAIYRTLNEVFDNVEVFAERDDVTSGGRTTFVLFSSDSPSGLARIDGEDGQIFVRIADQALDQLLENRKVPLLTDDYAPIDRLVGIGEL